MPLETRFLHDPKKAEGNFALLARSRTSRPFSDLHDLAGIRSNLCAPIQVSSVARYLVRSFALIWAKMVFGRLKK